MALTNETLRGMLIQYVGFDPGPEEVEHLLPLVERQMERMHALQALDLGGEDPRSMYFIADHRLSPIPQAKAADGAGGGGQK